MVAAKFAQFKRRSVWLIVIGTRIGQNYTVLVFSCSHLVWVHVEVVVGDDARDKLAVEVVVGGVDGPHAGVGVGVGVGASAKRPI